MDHESENLVNAATAPGESIINDTVDELHLILLAFLRFGVCPRMWKRDFSKAFRRVGVRSDHLQYAWVLWVFAGDFFRSQHLAQPMGSVSAVHAWHRVAALLTTFVKRILRCPTLRYVDDLFGASRRGPLWTTGICLDALTLMLGLPCP